MSSTCSTVSRSQVVAGGLAFGLVILFAAISAIPRVGELLPGQLLSWGAGLIAGSTEAAWSALWVSIGVIAASLAGAWVVFERQEL